MEERRSHLSLPRAPGALLKCTDPDAEGRLGRPGPDLQLTERRSCERGSDLPDLHYGQITSREARRSEARSLLVYRSKLVIRELRVFPFCSLLARSLRKRGSPRRNRKSRFWFGGLATEVADQENRGLPAAAIPGSGRSCPGCLEAAETYLPRADSNSATDSASSSLTSSCKRRLAAMAGPRCVASCRAQGLGDLASVLLVGPGRIGAVEDRRVGPAVTANSGTAGRALRDRAGDHGSESGDLGHDGRSSLAAVHGLQHLIPYLDSDTCQDIRRWRG